MKTCPQCYTQYTDDTLRFCLQDGTPLEAVSPAGPTAFLPDDEVRTAVRAKLPQESQVTQWNEDSRPPQTSRSKTPLVVLATAAALLVLLGTFGLAAWLYMRKTETAQNTVTNNSNASNARAANANSTRTPTPSPSPTPTPSNVNANVAVTPSPTPYADKYADKKKAAREVTDQIRDWNDLAQAGDLDAFMNKYAPTVDYYRKSGASAEFIRRDKQRAYSMFDSISLDISNMEVEIDDTGELATALFDKEWEFEGERLSRGKVRQQLRLRKTGGEWLIISEKDLKVYY